MPISEAKKRSNKKWNDANMAERYDRIQIVVTRGKKPAIAAHAATHGETLSGFINRAIDETVERDTAQEATT